MKLLGEKIWRLREKRGLSQEEFAERLGVSRQTVSNWENDRATPDAYKLKLLCEVLCVSADELLETGAESANAQETAPATPQEEPKTLGSEEVHSAPPKKTKGGRTVFAVLLSVLAAALVVVGIILIALPETGHGGASSVVIFTPTFGGIVLCVFAIGLFIPALLLFFKKK